MSRGKETDRCSSSIGSSGYANDETEDASWLDALDCTRLGKKLTGTWLGYASDETEDATDDSLDGNTHGNSKLTAVRSWRASDEQRTP